MSEQKKTVVHKMISDLKEIQSRGIKLTDAGMIQFLENSLKEEREQIADAFNEGWKYGRSPFQTFDYPTERYIGFTYENYEE
jgi:hypothetical protein